MQNQACWYFKKEPDNLSCVKQLRYKIFTNNFVLNYILCNQIVLTHQLCHHLCRPGYQVVFFGTRT